MAPNSQISAKTRSSINVTLSAASSIKIPNYEMRNIFQNLIDRREYKLSDLCEGLEVEEGTFLRFMMEKDMSSGVSDIMRKQGPKFLQALSNNSAPRQQTSTLPAPGPKRKRAEKEDGGATATSDNARRVALLDESVLDVSDVRLPGEQNDLVEVYDTCDEVRRKVR